MTLITSQAALEFIRNLPDNSVRLFAIDPPYYGIVDDGWDNQWADEQEFVDWLSEHLSLAFQKLTLDGSLVMFGGIGRHGEHPFFEVIRRAEKLYTFRNFITWQKRRAYGKSHDYLYCREEIVWLSKSPERTEVVFNIPYSNIERGYAGFNKKYPAKSKFKRISNVWTDIPELMRPKRKCQKPVKLLKRIVSTHSDPNDLVCDFFSGWGTTGIAALELGRKFLGCEAIEKVAEEANERCLAIANRKD